MTTYTMYVYCRRDGVSRDSGQHFRREYLTDIEAIDAARVELAWLLRHYDEVQYELKTTEGRKVI